MKKSEKTLKDLQVGDMVYHTEMYGNKILVNKIVRITKTQLVLSNGKKVNKESGREVGESMDMWHSVHYYPATDEIILKGDRQRVADFIKKFGDSDFDLSNANYKDLQKIIDTLEEIKAQWGKKEKK